MRAKRVGSSVVSATTQTPASGPDGPVMTPAMLFPPGLTAGAAGCCVWAGIEPAASKTAPTTSTGKRNDLDIRRLLPDKPVIARSRQATKQSRGKESPADRDCFAALAMTIL